MHVCASAPARRSRVGLKSPPFEPTGLLGAHLYAFVKLANTTTLCRSGTAAAAQQEPALATPSKQKPMWKQGGSDLGQLALRRPLPAPDRAAGCPELRPASANQPLRPRWPAISALFST